MSTNSMPHTTLSPLASFTGLVGRVCLCTIFVLSAAGNKIPNFAGTVQAMAGQGIPAPQVMLVGAIGFLLLGSVSIVLGIWPRIGATLLAVFIVLATYFFHDFWNAPADQQMSEMLQFMKNLALLGGLLIIVSQGLAGWTITRSRPAA